jgi:hypothetical protein
MFILSYHLRLLLPNGLFPLDFRMMMYACFMFPMRATRLCMSLPLFWVQAGDFSVQEVVLQIRGCAGS